MWAAFRGRTLTPPTPPSTGGVSRARRPSPLWFLNFFSLLLDRPFFYIYYSRLSRVVFFFLRRFLLRGGVYERTRLYSFPSFPPLCGGFVFLFSSRCFLLVLYTVPHGGNSPAKRGRRLFYRTPRPSPSRFLLSRPGPLFPGVRRWAGKEGKEGVERGTQVHMSINVHNELYFRAARVCRGLGLVYATRVSDISVRLVSLPSASRPCSPPSPLLFPPLLSPPNKRRHRPNPPILSSNSSPGPLNPISGTSLTTSSSTARKARCLFA